MKQNSLVARQTRRGALLSFVFLLFLVLIIFWPNSNSGSSSHQAARRSKDVSHEDRQVEEKKNGKNDLHVHLETPKFKVTTAPAVLHVGGIPDTDPEEAVPQSSSSRTKADHSVISFVMSRTMSTAWRSSSKRLSFPTVVTLTNPADEGSKEPDASKPATYSATATFYGKSSLKIKYTKRRSLHVRFAEPVKLSAEGPPLRNVLLLSLWEDKSRLAYRTAVQLLQDLGLFHSYAQLVELRCTALHAGGAAGAHDADDDTNVCHGDDGATLGAYLLLEYPSDAILRAAEKESGSPQQRVCESAAEFDRRKLLIEALGTIRVESDVEVGTRNWFYFEKPKRYDILHVPSYQRNSTISAVYASIEKDPMGTSLTAVSADASGPSGFRFDLNLYLSWIAVNSVLMNGDYDDEVFFYRVGSSNRGSSLISVMGWDYDTIYAPCHRKEAVPSRLMYCAETPIEHLIASSPPLKDQYREVLRCVLDKVATPQRWAAMINTSRRELSSILKVSDAAARATFDDAKNVPDVQAAASDLQGSFAERRDHLLSALPEERSDNAHNSDEGAANRRSQQSKKTSSTAKGCDLVVWRRQIASSLKSTLPKEHKAGRGRVSMAGLPTSKIDIILPLTHEDNNSATTSSLALMRLAKGQDSHISEDITKAGLYCARLTIPCSSSSEADQSTATATTKFIEIDHPFVLRGKERGSAEFGLSHFVKPPLVQLMAQDTTDLPASAEVRVVVPRKWVLGGWFPAVVHLTDATAARDEKEGGGSPSAQWVRRNIAVTSKDSSTMLVRGFSAVRFASKSSSWTDERDGPLLAWDGVSDVALKVGELTATAAMPSVVDVAAVEPIESLQYVSNMMGDKCVLVLEGSLKIQKDQEFRVGPGCLVVMKEGASLIVRGELRFEGTPTHPITVTSLGDDQQWITLHASGKGAVITMKHVFLTGSGVKGKLVAGTGGHHKHSAAITATDEATVTISDSYFLGLSGPAIAAGSMSTIRVIRSLVQWSELGIECVMCDFQTRASTWTHFPTWDASYEDADNDAMYLSGGTHRIVDSVVAHAKDDCIDSGTPEKSRGDGGSILIESTILEMCQHEAVALSSSPKSERLARLSRVHIQYSQQGVESGYTGRQHTAEVLDSTIMHTQVAIRFGDNYYNRPQNGNLKVSRVTLWGNMVNAINYVREIGAPQYTSIVVIQDSKIYEDQRTRMIREWKAKHSTSVESGDDATLTSNIESMCSNIYELAKPNQSKEQQQLSLDHLKTGLAVPWN